MALIKCKECGKEFSNEAKQCPHCGSTKHRSFFKKHPIISVLGSLFILGVIFNSLGLNKNGGSSHVATNVVSTQQSTSLNNNQSPSISTQQSTSLNTNKEEKPSLPIVKSNWNYSESLDSMRNTASYFAKTKSTNQANLDFPYNNSTMDIILRNNNGEVDLLLNVKGQFVCGYKERCTVSMKFDDGAIEKYDFTEAAHAMSDTVFIKSVNKFIEKSKTSKKLIIEADLFNAGSVQYFFDLEGLDLNKVKLQ